MTPNVSLQNYGGHRLDIIAQIESSLSQSNRRVDTVVLVQKGAPNDGTDVQPRLGFSLIVRESDGKTVDLLRGTR